MNILARFTPTFRQVLTLMSGTMVAQLVSFAFAPILTRVYSPSEFGTLGAYVAIVAIFSVVASLKYDAAILLPRDDSTARDLVRMSGAIALALSAVLAFAILLFHDLFDRIFDKASLGNLFYLAVVSIVAVAFFNIYCAALNRFAAYRGIAFSKISQTTGISAGQLAFGFLGFGVSGLILGRLLGEVLSTIVARIFLASEPRFVRGFRSRLTSYPKLAREYADFPKVTALHTFTNTVTGNLPVLLLSSYFASATEIGRASCRERV